MDEPPVREPEEIPSAVEVGRSLGGRVAAKSLALVLEVANSVRVPFSVTFSESAEDFSSMSNRLGVTNNGGSSVV